MNNPTIKVQSVAIFAVICARLAQENIHFNATEEGRNDFTIEILGY